jgi:hypothetical protein
MVVVVVGINDDVAANLCNLLQSYSQYLFLFDSEFM